MASPTERDAHGRTVQQLGYLDKQKTLTTMFANVLLHGSLGVSFVAANGVSRLSRRRWTRPQLGLRLPTGRIKSWSAAVLSCSGNVAVK